MEPTLSDAALVRLARGGDRQAVEALIDRHYEGVLAEGRRILRDEDAAEDLAQESFLLATLHLGRLREDERFGGWVRVIARNLARTWQRGEARASRLATRVVMEEATLDNMPDPAVPTSERMIAQEDVAELMRALAALDAEDRDLVSRHYLRHESQRQIAERLGVHHTTVSRRIESALTRLRGHLLPKAHGTVRAKLLCGAALSLPAATRAAIVQETAAEAARLTLPSWMTLLSPNIAATAAGVMIMTAVQKTIIGAGAALLLTVGGLYFSGGLASPSTPPSRVVAMKTGEETTLDLKPGESARITLEAINYPQNDMSSYVSDFSHVDFSADSSGNVTATATKRSGGTTTASLSADGPGLTNIHIWQEMNLLLVSSAVAEKTPTGARVTYFRANRPDLLPQAKALEAQAERGALSTAQLTQARERLMSENGLLPKNPKGRQAIMGMLVEK